MNRILIFLILGYKKAISPFLPGNQNACLYSPTCSEYAIEQLKTHSTFTAVPKIIWRVLSCNPINGWLMRRKNA